jgi:dTDP-4-amino-4,6-dideoxy-D-glucose acyltransferase
MAFLGRKALRKLGFAAIGANVAVSERASIYGAARIALGDHVRIDDFCVLSAGEEGMRIGSYVHIACYCSLIGKARIELDDFSGLSARVAVYSSSDDYSGAGLTNPTVPSEYRRVTDAPVRIGRHVIVGAGAVILPGVTIGEGAAVGALALVNHSLDPFTIYSGVPARRVGSRSRALLELEAQLRDLTTRATPATSRRRRARGRG